MSLITYLRCSQVSLHSAFVEVIGRVAGPALIEAMRIQSIPGQVDMENHNRLLELAHGQYRQLFT